MDKQYQALAELAVRMKERAYCPYSNFRVGAACLADDGNVYTGSNIENASYGGTVCGERVAIWNAVHHGANTIKALAVAIDVAGLPKPCGFCRQVMAEFAADDFVFLARFTDGTVQSFSMEELLPFAFTPKDLSD